MAAPTRPRRALVTGWFSFPDGEATAGDLGAADTVCAWLDRLGVAHDVARSPAFAEPPTLAEANPDRYTHLVFCCGPLAGGQVERLLDRYPACRSVAVGVSAVDRQLADRFDAVLARDGGDRRPTTDLAAGGSADGWPVVALIRANPQPEYGRAARHHDVHRVLAEALGTLPVAVVDADTRVDPRAPRQREVAQLLGVLGSADVVVTTRLHGLVLGLRCGTPVVAVDPVEGGAKVSAQAEALGWPARLRAGEVSVPAVVRWVDFCLGPEAGPAVAAAAARARRGLEAMEVAFGNALPAAPGPRREGAAGG